LCAGGELRFHKFCVEKGYLRGTCGFYRKAITFSHPVGGGLLLPPARWKTGTFDERTVEEWKFGRSHSGGPTLSVVGYDSVGSVIGERFDGPKQERIYLPPDLLIDASPKSEPVSS